MQINVGQARLDLLHIVQCCLRVDGKLGANIIWIIDHQHQVRESDLLKTRQPFFSFSTSAQRSWINGLCEVAGADRQCL